jgi:hypothetical protein
MPSYKFSVGKVDIKESGVTLEEVVPLNDIDIRYDVTTTRKYDADGVPLDEFIETESISVTVSYATEDGVNLSNLQNKDIDLYFQAGADGHGVSVTIASLKLTGYSYRQAQGAFTVVTLTFSKSSGDITSSPGDTPTHQQVYFGEAGSWVQIGDYASISTSYSGNARGLIIPTALGVLVRSTSELGGGQLDIKVNGYVKKTTRLELEQYLINLYSQLSTGKKSLRVVYGASTYTISDCVWSSGSPDTGSKKYSDFELSFIKSAY